MHVLCLSAPLQNRLSYGLSAVLAHKACYGLQAVMASLILPLVRVHACGSTPPYGTSAYWICPCSYGIYHCVAAVQRMVEEFIFPAEFRTDRFDHPELQQLAKALPAVLVCDRTATTVATYLRTYKSWKSLPVVTMLLFCLQILWSSRCTSYLSFNRPS